MLRRWLRPRFSAAAVVPLLIFVRVALTHAGQPSSVVPVDAWSEQVGEELATESGYDRRFPLHGVAFHVLAQVMSEPSEHAEVVGYMRRGAQFRAGQGKPGRGCDRTWHELASGGFVCAGRGFNLGPHPLAFDSSPVPPALSDPLPYVYAKNIAKSAMQFWRLPTRNEVAEAAQWLAAAPSPALQMSASSADQPPPPELKLPEFARMPMQAGFYVSVDREERDGEHAFVRTVRGAYVEAQALHEVAIAEAPGVVLQGAADLPLAIAYKGARLFVRDTLSGELTPLPALERFSHVSLADARIQHENRTLLQTRGGPWVSEGGVRVISQVTRPPLVPKSARLIHIDLTQQTLIAYEGERPVFATLVSTGKEGFETPKGVYRIYAKHVSATMDGMVGNDEAYSIEDVPWTMYFQGSYALHAAFWHDRFGNVRSHGCVNLAPADAHWLFRFATPVLPSDWHGVIATRDNPGTWVVIE